MASAALQLVRSATSVAAMLHPTRLKMLHLLASPDSASGLARRLEEPRQRINYHLRELERQGLVEFVEERRKGNCTERIVRASARTYVVSPEALGELGLPGIAARDRFSAATLIDLAARAIRDVAFLCGRAAGTGKRLATFSLESQVRFASAEDRNAFAEELTQTVAKLVARYHDDSAPRGRWFRFFVGALPAVGDNAEADSNQPATVSVE